MKWSEEARKALEEVPFFVRKRVGKRIEEEAARRGSTEVVMEHVQTCRQRFLTGMEEEVSGCQVETCFGPGGCPNRAIVCEELPEKIRKRLQAKDLKTFLKKIVPGPLKLHHEFLVSISDCPNACSRPQIVDIGLIGACKPTVTNEACSGCMACTDVCREEAISFPGEKPFIHDDKCLACGKCIEVCPTSALREGKKGYRLLLGGKLGRHPCLATEMPVIFSPEELPTIIDRIVEYYKDHCRNGERLGEVMERSGRDDIITAIVLLDIRQ